MHLREAHLPVADTSAAKRFYVEIVGLQFAHHDLTRDIVFLWAGADGKSMLALWGSSSEVVRAIPSALEFDSFLLRDSRRYSSSDLRLTQPPLQSWCCETLVAGCR